jgi:hypothetical protein
VAPLPLWLYSKITFSRMGVVSLKDALSGCTGGFHDIAKGARVRLDVFS